ncbi:hypothetical protein BRADI_3g14555v3 [Brachypodium distachyon]|uniref:Uncharacterized protein n=1 Tax=Brachypodium distachyon TaxID=15368 RepID=A0A2K2CX46_BRADI|nr:hypothetical protein BRADI_3g14555v3 [Brachypodium distachyon]
MPLGKSTSPRRPVADHGPAIQSKGKIAWSLHMESSGETNYGQTFYAITLIRQAYLEQSSATTFRCFCNTSAWGPSHPGGSTSPRLEGKPNFKRRLLSTTLLYWGYTVGSMMGCKPCTWACSYHRSSSYRYKQIHGTQLLGFFGPYVLCSSFVGPLYLGPVSFLLARSAPWPWTAYDDCRPPSSVTVSSG